MFNKRVSLSEPGNAQKTTRRVVVRTTTLRVVSAKDCPSSVSELAMNCFTHALPFLDRDDPYFLVGTCIPDWLSATDRKCRAREKNAAAFIGDESAELASLARGIVQHHQDDHWFHQTPMFAELNMNFSLEIRELLKGDAGFRPGLLGHILIELLLDAYLHTKFPGKLESYYRQIVSVMPKLVQDSVNRFASRPTDKLANFMQGFIEARYLFDYVDDQRLMMRINNVLKRIKLESVGNRITHWIPSARSRVYDHVSNLLPNYQFPL